MKQRECACGRSIRVITIGERQYPVPGCLGGPSRIWYEAHGACNRNGCVSVYLGSGEDPKQLAAEMQAKFVNTWRETIFR